jgi:hypothetical protein
MVDQVSKIYQGVVWETEGIELGSVVDGGSADGELVPIERI